jgi:glycopeptide antibiotics resistance protein
MKNKGITKIIIVLFVLHVFTNTLQATEKPENEILRKHIACTPCKIILRIYQRTELKFHNVFPCAFETTEIY